MQCPQCHQPQTYDDAQFCSNCGFAVLNTLSFEGKKLSSKFLAFPTRIYKGLGLTAIGGAAMLFGILLWDVGAPLEILTRLVAIGSFFVAALGVIHLLLAFRVFDFPPLNYLFELLKHKQSQENNSTDENTDNEHTDNLNQKFDRLFKRFKPKKKYLERVMIKSADEVLFLKAGEVDWIEPDGNYLKIHKGKETHLLRETMKSIESKLDPKQFVRIQRSAIVNVERINKLHPLFRGEYVVILADGTRLTSTRGYRHKLQEAFDADL